MAVSLIVYRPSLVAMDHRQKNIWLLVKPINLNLGKAHQRTMRLRRVQITMQIYSAGEPLVQGLDAAHFVPML
jgi:hypothetical protein